MDWHRVRPVGSDPWSDPRTRLRAGPGYLGTAPAAEDEAADREAQAERAESEGPDGDRLPPQREPAPAPDRLLLFRAQGLAAPLLPYGAAGTQTEIDVVEDLGRFVRHDPSV